MGLIDAGAQALAQQHAGNPDVLREIRAVAARLRSLAADGARQPGWSIDAPSDEAPF